MPDLLVRNLPGREAVRRDGFLATLDARTWRPRAHAAAALGDPEAVSSRAAYVAWLRRAAAGWARLPHPPAGSWPLVAVGPGCLALLPEIEADLRELGDVHDPAVPLARPQQGPRTDHAFVAAAAYVAVVAAVDAAVLAAAATSLVTGDPAGQAGSTGTRFLRACTRLAPAHRVLRRELADRAATHGPEDADRVVLTVRTLTIDLAEALQP